MTSMVAHPPVEVVQAIAVHAGACLRPVLQRLTDTSTGESRVVAIPCGATWAGQCPPCAEHNRRLRAQQCREGWHLTDDPIRPEDPDDEQDSDDQPDPDDEQDEQDEQGEDGQEDDEETEGGAGSRRVRSTRRRQDVPDLPRLPVAARTVGRSFTGRDGKSWQPSAFLTVTMPSYGPVRSDGTPRDPRRYDYRAAAWDALHVPKLWDRLAQNLRRAVGWRVQYFAAVEPQRRLAPHLHAAIRGAIPRALLRQVVNATYHQLWWPPHDRPVYPDPHHLPVWASDPDGGGRYLDPDTRQPLPTWDEALDRLDTDPTAEPAHVVRFGTQVDIQGLIAGPKADRRIGYLTKSIADGAAPDGELTDRRQQHADRLHHEVRYLPCSPTCANWLRFGIVPANAGPGMTPGHCGKKAHRPERLGCGGRRVLVSRHWTGKTLTEHAADRLQAVRAVLQAAGIDLPAGCSATDTRADGQPRWRWEPVGRNDPDAPSYRRMLTDTTTQRLAWREQYQHARDATGPPDGTSHSATAPAA